MINTDRVNVGRAYHHLVPDIIDMIDSFTLFVSAGNMAKFPPMQKRSAPVPNRKPALDCESTVYRAIVALCRWEANVQEDCRACYSYSTVATAVPMQAQRAT